MQKQQHFRITLLWLVYLNKANYALNASSPNETTEHGHGRRGRSGRLRTRSRSSQNNSAPSGRLQHQLNVGHRKRRRHNDRLLLEVDAKLGDAGDILQSALCRADALLAGQVDGELDGRFRRHFGSGNKICKRLHVEKTWGNNKDSWKIENIGGVF